MNILIRADSSLEIGTGHLMRCLTLAKYFRSKNHNVYFISRLHKYNLIELIENEGFEVLKLSTPKQNQTHNSHIKHGDWLGLPWEEDIIETLHLIKKIKVHFDWMIIDHYAIDYKWETKIKEYIPNLMIIDDLADREHNCDILLDQNYYLNATLRYKNKVPNQCHLMLGPKYSILRDEFIDFNKPKNYKKNNISTLIFYGGSDKSNESLKALRALEKFNIETHLVIGPSNPYKKYLQQYCNNSNIQSHYNINYMAQLMHNVDFAICAGGSTTWERYCVGTPGIITAIAYNQIELCENIDKLGYDMYIGTSEQVKTEQLSSKISEFIHDYDLLETSTALLKTVDGHGKKRILEYLELYY